jgi:Skp family chaperone for outer membrane proteins
LGREYAEKVGLSEDLIGRSMKGYVTPIPEFTQAVQEQIQQNMDRLFKNIYSLLKRKERNNRIQTLRKSLESSSTRKIEDEEFRQKLVEASRSDSR